MTSETVWEGMRTAAVTVFLFQKSDIVLFVPVLLKLSVDAVLAVFKAASAYQNGVNVLL